MDLKVDVDGFDMVEGGDDKEFIIEWVYIIIFEWLFIY